MFKKLTTQIIKESIPSGLDTDRDGKKWEDYETIVCPDGTIIDMVKLLDDQQRAKAALVHLAPFFGGFINNLRFIYTFQVKTQATDGYNLFVNPQFTNSLDLTEKCFVMAHEIMHCLLNHLRRGRGDDRMKSNIAADYECNISLVDMGLFRFETISKLGAYIDKKYSGVGYESIYKDISNPNKPSMNNKQQAQQARQNQNQSQQGGQSQSGQGQSGQGQSGQGSGQGGDQNNQQPQYSADYKKGWAQAIEDYKKGKLKL